MIANTCYLSDGKTVRSFCRKVTMYNSGRKIYIVSPPRNILDVGIHDIRTYTTEHGHQLACTPDTLVLHADGSFREITEWSTLKTYFGNSRVSNITAAYPAQCSKILSTANPVVNDFIIKGTLK